MKVLCKGIKAKNGKVSQFEKNCENDLEVEKIINTAELLKSTKLFKSISVYKDNELIYQF